MIERRYMSQLDALRFFAVMGVMVAHYLQPDLRSSIFGLFPWGELGVRLFFVLSGFLITGILIAGRELGEHHPARRLFFLRQFYVRRFLRIFPIYYAVLIVLLVANVTPVREIWPWLFTYSTNIYIWQHLRWVENVGHFWTLAVEEQFYLVWPWLMLFLPRRWLVPVLLGLASLAPIYRLYASFYYAADVGRGGFASGTLTIAVLDSLAIGALLAIASRADSKGERLQRVLGRVILPLGAASYATLVALSYYGDKHISVGLGQTAEALIFCWLIGVASRGFEGNFGRLLEWGPMAYLGKISYGIYVFHYFVPAGLEAAAAHVGLEYQATGITNFVACSLLTFAIAAASWQLFETRVNGLKRHFPYEGEREPHPLRSAAPATEGTQAVRS